MGWRERGNRQEEEEQGQAVSECRVQEECTSSAFPSIRLESQPCCSHPLGTGKISV